MIDNKLKKWISNYIKQHKPLTLGERLMQEYHAIVEEKLTPGERLMHEYFKIQLEYAKKGGHKE